MGFGRKLFREAITQVFPLQESCSDTFIYLA